jgi:hypothetical protein
MVNKTLRSSETREKTARKKGWTRPSALDAPPAPDGYKHRWIRESVRGFDDYKNISGKLREGWELVRADEYPDWELPTIEDGKHAGVIGAYYRNLTEGQKEAVDNDLLKIEDPRMPISKPQRQTKVTFGSGNKS